MQKKEVNEVIRQWLVFIGIIIVLPLLVLSILRLTGSVLTYGQLFFMVYQVGLVVFSVFMGISLFSRDQRDGGLEYMLTLPYTRLQLLWSKLLPRFLAVVAALGLYMLLLLFTSEINPVLPIGILSFLVFSLFLLGIPFSISKGSIVVSALATLFGFLVYLGIIHIVFPTALLLKGREVEYVQTLFHSNWKVPGYIYFSAAVLPLAAAAAFVYAFKRFHLGTSRGFHSRYLKVFIPVLVITVLVSLVWASTQIEKPEKFYYLTSHHQLVESEDYSLKIYDQKGVTDVDTKNSYIIGFNFLEKDNYLYMFFISKSGEQLVRINLRDPNYKAEVVYDVEKKTYVHRLYGYKDRLAFFERKGKARNNNYDLVVLHPDSGTIKKAKVYESRAMYAYPDLLGAVESEGQRSWLVLSGYFKHWEVIRIWEDGHKVSLGYSGLRPLYVKEMLITGEDTLICFNKITPQGLESIKKIPSEKDFMFIPEGFLKLERNLDHLPTMELYGGVKVSQKGVPIWKKIFRLDLEALELTEIKSMDSLVGFFDYSFPDTWYYTALDPESYQTKVVLKKLYRLLEGKFELVKEFAVGPFENGQYNFGIVDMGNGYFSIFDTGMVLGKDGKTTVYSLPSGEEIPFKRLE